MVASNNVLWNSRANEDDYVLMEGSTLAVDSLDQVHRNLRVCRHAMPRLAVLLQTLRIHDA